MKQKLILAALISFFCAASFAQTIMGSKHDLSTSGLTTAKSNESQICIFCHTPHQKTIAAKPLWNKFLSTTATYGIYSSSTLNATVAEVGGQTATGTTTTSVSNLCLSCHDGTVAVNSLDNTSTNGTPTMSGAALDATTGKIAATSGANMGTNLSNDHPINFTYDATLATADGALTSPASLSYVDAGKTVPLYNGSLQCATCHNPHKNMAEGSFLRVSNAGSALCLKCHSK